MRNANYQEKRGQTEIRNGVGFAELWFALEFTVLKGIRGRHFLAHHNTRDHQCSEIAGHGAYWDKAPALSLRQCEGNGKWKTHRGSEALFQML